MLNKSPFFFVAEAIPVCCFNKAFLRISRNQKKALQYHVDTVVHKIP